MKVPMALRLATSSMPLRDYDVILATSQSSKLSHSEPWSTIRVDCGPFKQTLSYNIMLLLLSCLLALFLFLDEFKVVFTGATLC